MAAWSKLEAYAVRLALVLHCLRHACGEPVSPLVVDLGTMSAAIELTHWCANETRRVYAVLREDEADAEQRKLLETLRAIGGWTTVRKWQRRRSIATSGEAKAQLQTLVAAGLARWELSATRAGGGPQEERLVLVEPEPVDEWPTGDGDGGHLSVSDLSVGSHESATPQAVEAPRQSDGDGRESAARDVVVGQVEFEAQDVSDGGFVRTTTRPPSTGALDVEIGKADSWLAPNALQSLSAEMQSAATSPHEASVAPLSSVDAARTASDTTDTDKCPDGGVQQGHLSIADRDSGDADRCAACGGAMPTHSAGQVTWLCPRCSGGAGSNDWEEYL